MKIIAGTIYECSDGTKHTDKEEAAKHEALHILFNCAPDKDTIWYNNAAMIFNFPSFAAAAHSYLKSIGDI